MARVVQHAPSGTQGREAALLDIAQDLLLRELHDEGVLELLVFKGGTALRKLYAGNEGRFSLDLDFSVAAIGDDADEVQELVSATVAGRTIGPFTYGIAIRRGKRTLTIDTPLGATGTLTSKLDVNPPPWLRPGRPGWVPMPVHAAYGGPLPELPCVQLEENRAEKIARLNRTTTARDVYDLVWL
ncbi:MAG: nucleotidyl transferase AbiEii/AbiGii toxin family protein [Kineosporiaceae bacterium]